MAAQNAGLTFMVGGCAKGYARGEPILKLMGKNVIHTGDSGTGQAAKVCLFYYYYLFIFRFAIICSLQSV
jgi:3-hydroxyisobutyrate dehydrogenase-like beta-hydroxyacid dehydrogenase